MKHRLLLLFMAIALTACKDKTAQKSEEASDEMETAEGMEMPDSEEWTVLFDGTSFEGWKGYLRDGVPECWKIEDGAMVLYPPENRPEGEQYNLVTTKDYSSFVLSLEWRISEGGNSGILWGVKEDEKYHEPYETGPEIQVLDNERHPDAKNGTTHQAGSLYDMVPPSSDVTKPVGEWNSRVITIDLGAHQGSVELNGEKIVSFPLANEEWDAMVAKSKFAGWEGFGKFTTGKIGLQDHGNQVAFRNIKIKEL
jgi:hypothetical protein